MLSGLGASVFSMEAQRWIKENSIARYRTWNGGYKNALLMVGPAI
jgi:hypothetical protein